MSRNTSAWLTEKYTSKTGAVYQRYVLDEDGHKILKNTEKSKQIMNKTPILNDTISHKAFKKKKIMPHSLLIRMRDTFNKQKKNQATIRSAEFFENNEEYRVVLFNEKLDWLLIHAMIKKNMEFEDKWFFLNPYTEVAINFDVEAHRKSGVKDSGLAWPSISV